MIFFNLVLFFSIAYSTEFPEREIRPKCYLDKVQSCIEEHQLKLSQSQDQRLRTQQSVLVTEQELASVIELRRPIEEKIASSLESEKVLANFFLKESSEKLSYLPLFSGGPTIFETKMGKKMKSPEDLPEYSSLNDLLSDDRLNQESSRKILEQERLILVNRINELESEVQAKHRHIQALDREIVQHGRMCEFGCKENFCREN